MQVIRSFENQQASGVSWKVNVMQVAGDDAGLLVEKRLCGLGAKVQKAGDLYTAMSLVMDDPGYFDMLVVDCDAHGGVAEVRRIVKLMGDTMLRVPVILVTSDCQTQVFAQERHEPTVLRAPLSAVSLRVAFEHVLRDRMVPQYL